MTISEALRHAGDLSKFEPEVVEGVTAEMPGYLWIDDNWSGDTGLLEYDQPDSRPRRLVHCGRCHEASVEVSKHRRYAVSYRQGQKVTCPFCRETVTVKHLSKGFRSIYNRLDVVFYRKSAVDPNVVVAIAAHCTREYRIADRVEPWTLEPSISVRNIAVFDPVHRDDLRLKTARSWPPLNGEAARSAGGIATGEAGWIWKVVKNMATMSFGDTALFMSQMPDRVVLTDTFDAAIRGTPIERAWCEDYFRGIETVRALHRITKYPCVEYLTKLGLTEFVCRSLDGTLPPNLINWNGKDMPRVLRLSKRRLGELKGKGIPLTVELCAVLQYVDARGIRCGIETAEGVALACRACRGAIKHDLNVALYRFPPERRNKALKYIARNRDRGLWDITDLWNMTIRAGGSLTADDDAFPRDFSAAHDRLAERLVAIENEASDKAIRRNLKKLEKRFGFAFGGLILRPAASAGEVVREGQQLHHCVGSYVDRYAAGQTVICVLRRAVEPDAPWRTVEISPQSGRVLQDRGFHNDWGSTGIPVEGNYRAMLDLFWEAWGERHKRKERKSA